MKGEALSLGLIQVGERARRLEAAARDTRREEMPPLQQALEASLPPSLQALDAWLETARRRSVTLPSNDD